MLPVVAGIIGIAGLLDFLKMSFLMDGGANRSQLDDRGVFNRPRRGGLDIHRRLPGLWVGLAVSLRSMPTALYEVFQSLSADANI